MALMVRSRRARSSSSVTSGPNSTANPRYPGDTLRSSRAQRVLLVSQRVQKHRKVAADLAIFQTHQLLARAADHHPIAFPDGHAEQGVPNRSANQIHLHA